MSISGLMRSEATIFHHYGERVMFADSVITLLAFM